MESFVDWAEDVPLYVIGALLLVFTTAALYGGCVLRARKDAKTPPSGEKPSELDNYIVSGALGLLSLLIGFTFSLAVDRFDLRRTLVIQDANAISTAYLRSQLLAEPHRARLSGLLVEYTADLLVLAKAQPDEARSLLASDDRHLADIWAAAEAGFDTIRDIDFSSTFIDSINSVIELDASRRTARAAKVPTTVFAVLFVYLIAAAGAQGYVLVGVRRRAIVIFPFALLILSLLLILDIDRPTMGGIREPQGAMERLLTTLKSHPPGSYDHWRGSTPAP